MVLASGEGLLFLLRWLHFLAGITWILFGGERMLRDLRVLAGRVPA